MSKTFAPRSVDPSAWKAWHKDALKLMGRVGLGWLLLWGLVLPAGAYQVSMATKDAPVLFFALLLILQVAGAAVLPVLYQALDRAARNESMAFGAVLAATVAEMKANPGYLRRQLAYQAVVFAVVCAVLALVFGLASLSEPDPSAPPRAANPYGVPSSLLVAFVFMPTMLRRFGAMSFQYWFEARHGLGKDMSEHLQRQAQSLNQNVFLFGFLSLFAIYLVGVQLPFVSLLVLPALHWYFAAYARCAYHDVFEGGTGVEEKETVRALSPSPVLQA